MEHAALGQPLPESPPTSIVSYGGAEPNATLSASPTPPTPDNGGSETPGDDDGSSSDDESMDEKSSNSSSEPGDLAEPALKYAKVGGDLAVLLHTDAVSCATCTEKFLVIGTHSGLVLVVDFSGAVLKRYTPHPRATVSAVSVTSDDETIVSAGDDGRVIVYSLAADRIVAPYAFSHAVSCVALDPSFSKSGRFAAGDVAGKVSLVEKSWRGTVQTVIDNVVGGSVLAIQWRGSLVAYVTDQRWGIYDAKTASAIILAQVPFTIDRPALYRPHIVWRDDETLVLGWYTMLQIIQVRIVQGFRDMGHQANVVFQATLDVIIGGVQPLGERYLVLGVHEQSLSRRGEYLDPDSPEMLLLDPTLQPESRITSRDQLLLDGHERLRPTEYELHYVPADNMYHIIARKAVIDVRPRDMNDQLEWRMVHDDYEGALELALALSGRPGLRPEYQSSKLGDRILGLLVARGDVQRAAELCPRALGKQAHAWETWVYWFFEQGALDHLLPYIPLQQPVLEHTVYELILCHYLSNDFGVFCNLVAGWPASIYTVPTILGALEEMLLDFSDNRELLSAAAILYHSEKLELKELTTLMRLDRYSDAIALLDENPLLTAPLLRGHAIEWFEFCFHHAGNAMSVFLVSKALEQIAGKNMFIPPEDVTDLLKARPDFQFAYLYTVFDRNVHAVPSLHSLLLSLIVAHAPQLLLDFLHRSLHYPLDVALKSAEDLGMLPEQVYILGRMGNHKRAMRIMMEKMGDIDRAIEYAKQQADDDVWDDLLDFAVEKPQYWDPLFRNTCDSLNPIKLLQRVPQGACIPGLRSMLRTIVHDAAVQLQVRQHAHAVLARDMAAFLAGVHKQSSMGVLIGGNKHRAASDTGAVGTKSQGAWEALVGSARLPSINQ
ncbi:hypothetical protein BC828DRAFT_376351 [Blastocladiella britannica]|nr:hypothetical protein BC828DRAFT_376351 [Blastocladiella britannica]